MNRKTHNTSAFTLIELLTVIAIIGILSGILIPTVGTVREKAKIATSKARISQYLTAIQSFKGEYSYYPFSRDLDDDGQLDLSEVSHSKTFFQTLSARDIQNPSSSVSGDGNRRRIQFYTFAQDEVADGNTSGATADTIIDAFENNQIIIVFDHDDDGEVTVPDPEGASGDTKKIRSKLTAYVLENDEVSGPSYYLYD